MMYISSKWEVGRAARAHIGVFPRRTRILRWKPNKCRVYMGEKKKKRDSKAHSLWSITASQRNQAHKPVTSPPSLPTKLQQSPNLSPETSTADQSGGFPSQRNITPFTQDPKRRPMLPKVASVSWPTADGQQICLQLARTDQARLATPLHTWNYYDLLPTSEQDHLTFHRDGLTRKRPKGKWKTRDHRGLLAPETLGFQVSSTPILTEQIAEVATNKSQMRNTLYAYILLEFILKLLKIISRKHIQNWSHVKLCYWREPRTWARVISRNKRDK